MTTFLMARIHPGRLRELVAAWNLPPEYAPIDMIIVACPRCGAEFFPDLDPEEEPITLEEDEWAARVRLDGECPDHAHRFEVGE